MKFVGPTTGSKCCSCKTFQNKVHWTKCRVSMETERQTQVRSLEMCWWDNVTRYIHFLLWYAYDLLKLAEDGADQDTLYVVSPSSFLCCIHCKCNFRSTNSHILPLFFSILHPPPLLPLMIQTIGSPCCFLSLRFAYSQFDSNVRLPLQFSNRLGRTLVMYVCSVYSQPTPTHKLDSCLRFRVEDTLV